MPVAEIPLKGAHNVENVLAAVCAARLAGWRRSRFARRWRASRRWSIGWSLWRRCNGVEFYNDSKATNVDATKKALEAFPGGDSFDSGREGQGLGLHGVERSAAGAGESCLHDWFGGGEDRAASGGSGRR